MLNFAISLDEGQVLAIGFWSLGIYIKFFLSFWKELFWFWRWSLAIHDWNKKNF